MIVLLFGPPGCGKGTQAALIAQHFHIPAISTGEMFRAECRAGTELGRLACSILKSGGLVGDTIVEQIVAARIQQPDCASGFLLDGFPRTLEQAVFLDALLRKLSLPKPIAIHLDVPAQVLVSRITARRQCGRCGRIYNMLSQPPKTGEICDDDQTPLIRREDDTEGVILARLKAYHDATGPVVAYYQNGGCHRVDATGTPAVIWCAIERLLAGESEALTCK
ncbi:MAG TPA: nucleoside monophosphate kinase [Bryobacteraceae bacterium]|nr:nucleoside monophosphate kinase [Bryobacteraceae bacterium]